MLNILFAALALLASGVACAQKIDDDAVARGRYLVKVGGCNDSHTAGYAANGATTPESQWLTGDALGWNGAWGTTYAPNLRLRLAPMSRETWTAFARHLKTRPPMPYWALNAMTDDDLVALWSFVQRLGPGGEPAPAALAPGVEPRGPVVRFPAPPPEVATR